MVHCAKFFDTQKPPGAGRAGGQGALKGRMIVVVPWYHECFFKDNPPPPPLGPHQAACLAPATAAADPAPTGGRPYPYHPRSIAPKLRPKMGQKGRLWGGGIRGGGHFTEEKVTNIF